MQIHELNNYNGNLDSGAYFAVDNGADTGKVSASGLFAGVENEINQLSDDLNARIDNIIAGGDAPSAAEVTDARLGAASLGSVSYGSLGAAIRGQVDDLANDINYGTFAYGLKNQTYINNTNGAEAAYSGWKATDFIDITGLEAIFVDCSPATVYNAFYDSSKVFISSFSLSSGFNKIIPPDNACYIRISNTNAGMLSLKVFDFANSKSASLKENFEQFASIMNKYPRASAIASYNIFTWWELGYISYSDGKEHAGTSNIRSANYIEVESGETYRIYDPEAISSTARNTQYLLEYDDKYRFIKNTTLGSTNVVTMGASTKYIRFSSQTVGTQGFVIGDYQNYKTMISKGSDLRKYVTPEPIAKMVGVENTAYKMASAKDSSNIYYGGCLLSDGFLSDGTPAMGSSIIITPFIEISNEVYWQMFGGKTGDLQYLYEYDSDHIFIKYTTLSGNKSIAGQLALDEDTQYIRFRTQTQGTAGYVLPDLEWFDAHLVVMADSITRYQNSLPVVSQSNVSDNFYDTAVSFEGFEYNKIAADPYIQTIMESAYDLVIPFITDTHTEQPQPYDLHNYIAASGAADVAFNLGDNIPLNYPTRAKAIQTLRIAFHEEYLQPRKCEVYALCGNHDYNPYGNNAPEYTINQALYYSLSEARTKKGYAKSGVNYGFVDFDAPKVRVIWLDSGDIFDSAGQPVTTAENTALQQEQFTWFCNVALDFMDKADRAEWSVITVSHDSLTALSDTGFTTVIKAFLDGTSASGTAHCVNRGSDIPQAYNVDFAEQGPMEYICHVCGHQHYDRINTLGTTGRKQIYITTDNIDQDARYWDDDTQTSIPYSRTRGTIEERCIDSLCLDKANRTVTMKRLGVGSDRVITY